MLWTRLSSITVALSLTAAAHGAGMTIHMHYADESLKYLQEEGVKTLIQKNRRAFRNGSIYPDSGYIGDDFSYGEWAHWSPFHNLYLQKIASQCELPLQGHCAKLFAHLLGTIAHSVGDMTFDRDFVPLAAQHDFGGDWDKANDALTLGLDFHAILTKGRAFTLPRRWVPLDDLVPLFPEFESDQAGLRKKMASRTHIHMAGHYGERFGAGPGLLYLKIKNRAKWSYKNFKTAPGGLDETAKLLATIYDDIWRSLQTNGLSRLPTLRHHHKVEGRPWYWVEPPAPLTDAVTPPATTPVTGTGTGTAAEIPTPPETPPALPPATTPSH